jgi:hypothetical protein
MMNNQFRGAHHGAAQRRFNIAMWKKPFDL